jgi:hypothetical protein
VTFAERSFHFCKQAERRDNTHASLALNMNDSPLLTHNLPALSYAFASRGNARVGLKCQTGLPFLSRRERNRSLGHRRLRDRAEAGDIEIISVDAGAHPLHARGRECTIVAYVSFCWQLQDGSYTGPAEQGEFDAAPLIGDRVV